MSIIGDLQRTRLLLRQSEAILSKFPAVSVIFDEAQNRVVDRYYAAMEKRGYVNMAVTLRFKEVDWTPFITSGTSAFFVWEDLCRMFRLYLTADVEEGIKTALFSDLLPQIKRDLEEKHGEALPDFNLEGPTDAPYQHLL